MKYIYGRPLEDILKSLICYQLIIEVIMRFG